MKTLHTLILALTIAGLAGAASAAMPERVVLENGLTVILAPIAGSGQVAVEACYRTGIIDEHQGTPQISHLTEHVACQAATKSFKAGESYALLSRDGRMTNAETMLGFTHYDYVVPSADLDLALQVESERLTSLQITREIVEQERPKCTEEFGFVESRKPTTPYKFAFMALNQVWRDGKLETVNIKSDIKHASYGNVRLHHQAQYKTTGTAIVMVGDFDRDKALATVRKHFGEIPTGRQTFFIDWEHFPRVRTARWDGKSGIVCIVYYSHYDDVYQYLLNTWGGLITEKLSKDKVISKLAEDVYCGDPVQCLRKMPFYVYAAAKPGVNPADLQRVLELRLAEYLDKAEADGDIAKVLAYGSEIGLNEIPSRDTIQSICKQMPASADPAMAEGMVMGQVALQLGFEEMLTYGHLSTWMVAKHLTSDEVLERFRGMLDPKTKYTTLLTPMEGNKP